VFRRPQPVADTGKGFTLAQKMVGKACGVKGIRPGTYCEPKMTTVGSQDTTGPMTRDELKDLACLGFSADLTMQSFCHTAAYPKPIDVQTHHTLPDCRKQQVISYMQVMEKVYTHSKHYNRINCMKNEHSSHFLQR
jgi:aconitate hydratase 2/2-methylisocitrate dehydratase